MAHAEVCHWRISGVGCARPRAIQEVEEELNAKISPRYSSRAPTASHLCLRSDARSCRRPSSDRRDTVPDDWLEVVDYDASARRYFRAVDLNHHEIAMSHGLEPLESDPQFHQQMVYAVASKVLENFDRALGRRLRFKGGQRLRLFPHAFHARNAYFYRKILAVLFGYFRADEDDPGPNLPGQLIFTCLSHDALAIDQVESDLV